jgi:hypothetical protein
MMVSALRQHGKNLLELSPARHLVRRAHQLEARQHRLQRQELRRVQPGEGPEMAILFSQVPKPRLSRSAAKEF